ncbi:MAG: hypothetical protein AB1Z98_38395 [Nannocystaceae bacterium]
MLLRSLALTLALALVGPTDAAAAAGPGAAPSLRSVRGDAQAVVGLRVEASAACRAQVLDELITGQRRGDGCAEDRERVGRALVRWRDRFGFVERRVVELATLRLVLGVAKRCRQWPLRSPGRDVLRRNDVDLAGCRVRRYEGPLTLTFIDHEGRASSPLAPLHTDVDGRLMLRFSSIDQALRALGRGELADYTRIELGDDAWAGHVDLDQLLRFRADWHLSWIRRGRGTAGLFAAEHPEHPGAEQARTWAADARLARQEQDVARVESGELTARDYLDRHPWSPYRRRVQAWLRARAAIPAQPGDGSEPGASSDPKPETDASGGGRSIGTGRSGGP